MKQAYGYRDFKYFVLKIFDLLSTSLKKSSDFSQSAIDPRTLFVGTTPDNHETTRLKESEVEETNGGFTVPLPTEGSKVKYIKIKYSFK